jgi:hypothetical protein
MRIEAGAMVCDVFFYLPDGGKAGGIYLLYDRSSFPALSDGNFASIPGGRCLLAACFGWPPVTHGETSQNRYPREIWKSCELMSDNLCNPSQIRGR